MTDVLHAGAAGGGGTAALLRRAVLVVVGLALGVAGGLALVDADDGPGVVVGAASLEDEVDVLERDVAEDPDDLVAWQRLAAARVALAEQTGDAAQLARAEAALDAADRIAPDDPATTVGRGQLALARHAFDDALRLGRDALARAPSSPAALAVVVDAQVELGRYDAAAATLQQLLDVRPGLPALARTSYLRELSGDLDGAVVAMQQAVTAAGVPAGPALADVSALLGDLLLRTGQVAAAEAAYRDARVANGGALPGAEVGLARVEVARGERETAVARLEDLVEAAPRLDALLLLGDVQRLLGDRAAAAATDELVGAASALAAAGGQVVDLELALFEVDHGQPRRALQLALEAYEARPTVFTRIALASALVAAGEPDRAAPFADDAVAMGTPHAELLVRAALVAAAAGEDDVAVERLGDAFALAPWFAVGLADDAVRLADRLGVQPPPAWSSLGG